LDGLRPPSEYEADVNYESVIIEFVRKKGCSYPAEIMRELGISKDTVYLKLFKLVKEDWLMKHNLYGTFKVPSWLKPRLKELWNDGKKGDSIRHMSWYTLPGVEDTAAKDMVEEGELFKKRTTIIDYWTNINQGVEPSKEQIEASKDGKLTTDGVNIVEVGEQKEALKDGGA